MSTEQNIRIIESNQPGVPNPLALELLALIKQGGYQKVRLDEIDLQLMAKHEPDMFKDLLVVNHPDLNSAAKQTLEGYTIEDDPREPGLTRMHFENPDNNLELTSLTSTAIRQLRSGYGLYSHQDWVGQLFEAIRQNKMSFYATSDLAKQLPVI